MRMLCCVPDQAAEKARWGVAGGPWLRAQAARWLWFSPATLPAGVAHANQLLREFALSAGRGAAESAQALLALLPEEVRAALEQVRVQQPVYVTFFLACL